MLNGYLLNYLSQTNPFSLSRWYFIRTYPFGARKNAVKNTRRKERKDVKSVLRKINVVYSKKIKR